MGINLKLAPAMQVAACSDLLYVLNVPDRDHGATLYMLISAPQSRLCCFSTYSRRQLKTGHSARRAMHLRPVTAPSVHQRGNHSRYTKHESHSKGSGLRALRKLNRANHGKYQHVPHGHDQRTGTSLRQFTCFSKGLFTPQGMAVPSV
jgi:hypothetical protein